MGLMKNKRKLFLINLLVIVIVVMGFFGVAVPYASAADCSAKIVFNPSSSPQYTTEVVLEGDVTLKDIATNGSCQNYTKGTSIPIVFSYLNGTSYSKININYSIPVDKFSNNIPVPFRVLMDAELQANTKKGQSITLQACVGETKLLQPILTCSAPTTVKVGGNPPAVNPQAPATPASPGTVPGTPGTPGSSPGTPDTAVGKFDCTAPNAQSNPEYTKHCLVNPLPVDNLVGMLLLMLKGFLTMIGIWSVVYIVVGGFRLVMAQGDEEAYTTAKKTITWAVAGFAIALLSFSLIAIVQNLLGADLPSVNGTAAPASQNK